MIKLSICTNILFIFKKKKYWISTRAELPNVQGSIKSGVGSDNTGIGLFRSTSGMFSAVSPSPYSGTVGSTGTYIFPSDYPNGTTNFKIVQFELWG